MRQTRLDASKKEKEEQVLSVKEETEQAAAGSKRKEPASDVQEKPSRGGQDESSKSRKTEPSDDGEAGGKKVSNSSPPKLTDDQSEINNKLKGDDVEINKGNSDGNKEVPWHVTEKGLIYFFYRPKVMSADKAETNSTESLDDVQNTFMLLVPRSSESDTAPASDAPSRKKEEQGDKRVPPNPTAYRLVSLGKKRMPSPEAALKSGQEPGGIGGRHSEAIWATVADIGADLKAVSEGLGEEHYSTKTRGKSCIEELGCSLCSKW